MSRHANGRVRIRHRSACALRAGWLVGRASVAGRFETEYRLPFAPGEFIPWAIEQQLLPRADQ